jgi:DNA-binding beta-propeller fold protein YncE
VGSIVEDKPGCDETNKFLTKLSAPQGLVAAIDTNLVYVCDKANRRVVVLNSNGERIRSIGKSRDGSQLKRPWAVALGFHSLFVTDRGSNNVKSFSLRGELQCIFEGDLRSPTGVCVDQARRWVISVSVVP